MRKETENNILKLHETSWKGLWQMLIARKTFLKLPFIGSTAITLVVVIVLFCKNFYGSYDVVEKTCESALSFFPNLLGFTLGGFAIIVGFGNSELIKEGASIQDYSTYQILNAVFSYSILVQTFVTLLSFFISWCIKIKLYKFVPIENEMYCNIINFILFTIILFFIVFSLLIIPLIIINLFSFSQVNSSFYTIKEVERLEAELDEEEALQKGLSSDSKEVE